MMAAEISTILVVAKIIISMKVTREVAGAKFVPKMERFAELISLPLLSSAGVV
jgi:hypothetical protein